MAIWHVSEDASIERFEPRANPEHDSAEPLVWAIDSPHVAAYWFPRECPRGTFWAVPTTSERDVARFLGGDRSRRVHLLQEDWLPALRSARVFSYRLPPDTFERYERANGYWVSREPVGPLAVEALGDLETRHVAAGIELRIVPHLLPLWEEIAASTLEFSGIRLRNLRK
jgi:nucleotide-binding universal stress UspA family protein